MIPRHLANVAANNHNALDCGALRRESAMRLSIILAASWPRLLATPHGAEIKNSGAPVQTGKE